MRTLLTVALVSVGILGGCGAFQVAEKSQTVCIDFTGPYCDATINSSGRNWTDAVVDAYGEMGSGGGKIILSPAPQGSNGKR